MQFKNLLCCLLAALLFTSVSQISAQGLKDWADPKKVYIGNIVSTDLINNISGHEGGRAINNLKNEYNAIVFENDMKMGNVLPTSEPPNIHSISINALKNSLQTVRINRFLNNANFNGMRKRGHAFIWFNQAPGWLNNNAPNWTAEQVFEFSRKYIYALADVCGNEIDEWDVINEAINDSSAGWREDRDNSGNPVWYEKAGDGSSTCYGPATYENYIKMLFIWARDAQPSARLYYNDYSIEFFSNDNNSKNKFMRGKMTEIKNNGAPIDGIGFQSHLRLEDCVNSDGSINTGYLNGVKASMEDLDGENFEVAITELDIRRCGGDNRSSASLENAFYQYSKMFLEQPNCREILVWGQHDNVSWITPFLDSNCGEATLYSNSNYNEKVAYNGIRGAIQSQPNRSSFGFRSLRGNGSNSAASCGGGGGPATPAVNSVTVSDDVTRGGTANVSINYSAGNNQDVWVNFQLDQSPWTSYSTARIDAVSGANNNVTIPVNIPSNTPIANNAYQFQVVVAPNGGAWGQRLANLARNNVDVIGGGSGQLIANGTYYIKKASSSHYIYAVGNTTDLKSRGNTNGNNSRWTFTHLGNDEYEIRNVGFNQRMEIPSGATGQGQKAARTSFTGNADHLVWKALDIGSGDIQFLPKHDQARALDIWSGNANVVHLWGKNANNSNQRFNLVATSASRTVVTQDLRSNMSEEIFEPSAFPNPTEGDVTIEGLLEGRLEINVFSVTGAIQFTRVLEVTGRTKLDLSAFKPGVYMVSLTQDDEQRVIRVSKN